MYISRNPFTFGRLCSFRSSAEELSRALPQISLRVIRRDRTLPRFDLTAWCHEHQPELAFALPQASVASPHAPFLRLSLISPRLPELPELETDSAHAGVSGDAAARLSRPAAPVDPLISILAPPSCPADKALDLKSFES
ncbi:hypothetical protein EVG20_g8968 [Dentipellis fragilis]|uniref:Uncharacterized protein n=1 Tax=Dentipellis fragilis TaxID=205917 RepID=A0A4Y9Y678_9AGAM|nr:hypothetical protein EVG20_g8968 [Dentipellis fragilis]